MIEKLLNVHSGVQIYSFVTTICLDHRIRHKERNLKTTLKWRNALLTRPTSFDNTGITKLPARYQKRLEHNGKYVGK